MSDASTYMPSPADAAPDYLALSLAAVRDCSAFSPSRTPIWYTEIILTAHSIRLPYRPIYISMSDLRKEQIPREGENRTLKKYRSRRCHTRPCSSSRLIRNVRCSLLRRLRKFDVDQSRQLCEGDTSGLGPGTQSTESVSLSVG